MNDTTNPHTLRPEFRASLEQNLVGTFRREVRFAPYYRFARNARVRTVTLIVLGAVLGVGCGFASAQVRESQTRSELLIAAEASLKVAALRVELAQDRLKRVQRMFDAGVIARSELSSAQSEVHSMELILAQANLDMEEIRASATSPRPELWAPVVGGRDFVKLRLQLNAALAQQHLTDAEALLKELDSGLRAGVIGPVAKREGLIQLLKAQQDMTDVTRQLVLRQQFIEEKLDVAKLSQQLKTQELESTIALLGAQSKLAEQRTALARTKVQVGTASEIDLKRAELDLLVLKSRLVELSLELKAFQGGRREQ